MAGTARILIVEDEAITAMELEDRLTSMGYDLVGVVSDGESAIRKTAEMKPDLVLMDIMITGDMDGIETAECIRRDFAVPIIYLTAYSDERILKRAKVTGPYGYIIKPFEERELHANIEMSLHRNKLEIAMKEARDRAAFFVDLMAHDLTNINQAISGTLEFLLFDETLPDHVADIVLEAVHQVNRSTHLIRNVRKFNRIDDNPPELTRINPSESVIAAAEAVQHDIPDKTLEMDIDLRLASYHVMADGYLVDVFYSLLHNAMQYSPKEIVRVEVKVVVPKDESVLRIQVMDNGLGIPDTSKETLFERISLKKTGHLGTGIGLTLLKHIIDHYGGKVWVEDRVTGAYTQGASFILELPRS